MASFKLNQAHSNCADCPIHDKLSLKRLGVDAENSDYVVALAGNPNTGKSTIFNALTGLKQHTGNWTGKTVARTEGSFFFHDKKYKILDLPGTYSLISSSLEEEIARNFILFGKPDVTVIVVDATRLERNLNLAIQILEISGRVVICLNLIDEAEKKGIGIDTKILSRELGVPVVATAAREQRGIYDLLSTIEKVARSQDIPRARQLYRIPSGIEKQIETLEKNMRCISRNVQCRVAGITYPRR
ncbi:MAG: FeoB small GTPase domain-containing protein [Cyclobacteriaceae bacterium]|nr:FeoB small GTPase domain-containing protein [Cyclobacteriaceae bacterium]